jgi:hypothetical protein
MKEKTEKFFWLFLVPLGVGMILLIVNAVIGGITFKMVYETLMDLDILNVFGVSCLIISAVFGVLYAKQRWKASIVKKEAALSDLKSKFKEEKKHLKSELEDKTKEYNELYEKTKPPYSVDKLIKAEANYKPIGRVGIEGKPPHLIFDIRMINRTNYYFTPKKVFLACYHGEDCVFKEEWEERAKTPHIFISELQRLGDGSIQFHVPKEKIENNMRELTLKKGYVEYTTEEEIIHDTRRKSVKVNIPKLEYALDGETPPEAKGRVIIVK